VGENDADLFQHTDKQSEVTSLNESQGVELKVNDAQSKHVLYCTYILFVLLSVVFNVRFHIYPAIWKLVNIMYI